MKKIIIAEKIILMILLPIILCSTIVLAENDPGHDTLYIEEQGSSELNGSLNVTGNVSIEDIIFSGVALDIRGDDEQTGTNNRIVGINGAGLSIQSTGNIYINTLSGTTSMVYLGDGADSVDLNITGALFFGGDNELNTSAASGAASLDLYWGDKLICDASETNCGWVTSAGSGDVSGVYGDNIYIYNGSGSGEITLVLNETKLNATIDAKVSATGDGNNYTQAIGFNATGSTLQINLNRTGMNNLTSTITMNDTTRALAGYANCTGNQVLQNFSMTNSGSVSICITPTATGDGNNYTTAIGFNTTGSTLQINLNRTGMNNLTSTITMNDTTRAYPVTCTGQTAVQTSTSTTAGTCIGFGTSNSTLTWIANGTGLTGGNITTGGMLNLSTTGATAGRYGNNTAVAVCDIDTYGRITGCTNTSITFPTDQNNYTTGAGLNVTGSTLQIVTNITGRTSITNSITMNDTTRTLAGYINLTGNSCIQNLSLLSTGLSYSSITPAGSTYTADNYTLTLTGTQFTLNTTYTNNTYLLNTGDLATGNYTFDTSTLHIDSTNDKIGIGTIIPLALLHLNSTSNQLRISYDNSNYGNISVNSGGNLTIKATGHVIIDLS